MDKEHMKSEITRLIEKYNREKGKRYNEEATKNDFILPLFKILGWNTEDSNEVSKEENISGKRVDYGFRIDGIPKFFLEAKGLDEDLEGSRMVKGRHVTYAEQAINYAYYKGCNWAILSNFKGLIVYDAWAKSSQSSFRFAIWVDSLLSDFESVYLLSKEAFEQGLLDKKYSTKSRKRPITEQLLLDFTTFRSILSKDVYNLNKSKNLTEEELDEAIQRLFDRLIFIRNCEDRELEPYELLSMVRQWKESRKGTLVSKIRELFVHFDDTYNSKIFSKHLCDQVDISDEVLSRVLDGSIQYDFSLIDADVLGNIYEQYLGHILKKTEKRTKLTESKAKRKEEGIYYTPSYIVDYIVRNTVGELVKNKKIDVSKIKVLDPACGSGSFLIKTFDILNEYYSKKEGYNQNKLDMSGTGTTYSTKLSILKDNIFGVDLDKQAVDIAQLNLLLKVAEKKRRLPILQQNIKNGNSLIDDPNLAGDKAFKWNEEFAEIMKNGGFDVIVGNPPYLNVKRGFFKEDQNFLESHYKTARGQYDLYRLFIEKGISLLKDGGFLGFIIPRRSFTNENEIYLREFLLKNCNIRIIVDVGAAFSDASVEAGIIIIQKGSPESNNKIVRQTILMGGKKVDTLQSISQKDISNDKNLTFNIQTTSKNEKILKKIESDKLTFGELAKITRGVEIGKKSEFIINKPNKYPVLFGEDVSKYYIKNVEKWIEFSQNDTSNFKKESLYLQPKKLLIRRVGNDIIATIDYKQRITLNTLYIVEITDNSISPEYLCGLLNSRLIRFWFKNKFVLTEKIFPYIRISQLLQIPIKKDNDKKLVNLVEKMFLINEKLLEFDGKQTDYYQRLENERNEIDSKIDEIIYKIYGITEEEKKVIEESLR